MLRHQTPKTKERPKTRDTSEKRPKTEDQKYSIVINIDKSQQTSKLMSLAGIEGQTFGQKTLISIDL